MMFYVLVVILLPVIGLVDGIGFLTGLMKVGERDTWDDDVLRIANNARNIEIGIGLASLGYLNLSVMAWWVLLYVIAPSTTPLAPIWVLSLVLTVYAPAVFWWSDKHDVDPLKGARSYRFDN